MEVGCYVINLQSPELGVGEVIKFDRSYVTVYFPSLDENREYLASNNALKKTNNAPEKFTLSGAKKQSPIILRNDPTPLDNRVQRDQENAHSATQLAREALRQFSTYGPIPDIHGPSENTKIRESENHRRHADLLAIRNVPFHVMAEVEATTLQNGKEQIFQQILYAHENTRTNNPLTHNGGRINVMSWTHPAIQIALTRDLHEIIDIKAHGYTLMGIKPLARARFSQVLPSIVGLYEPGGIVGKKKDEKRATGLKAVKLQMTKDQVDAFLSKMNGMMLVTGAPGSGKTTVAMQRIRFLYDQQGERVSHDQNVRYEENLTKIFLANENLITYSKELLEKGLQIPASVVELVDTFLGTYLNDLWTFKHGANPRRRKLFHLEDRARLAFFGLCGEKDLRNCWQAYEEQIASRLAMADEAEWLLSPTTGRKALSAMMLAVALKSSAKVGMGRDPLSSRLTMDALYNQVEKNYESTRRFMQENGALGRFDTEFYKWLYWVYDPFDALVSFFGEHIYEGKVRIKKGMASRIDENQIVEGIQKDWEDRVFGKEEIPWLAFLLRFALPENTDQRARFREMPNPLAITGILSDERWTHVMIDEAQDLCVAQAAVLGSLVHPYGAFTVSADFNQVVSPVWGMENPEAFKVGISLRDKGVYQSFPFARNMRQSRQIGLFLQSFFQSVFGKIAPFEVNDQVEGPKPLLFVGNQSEFASRIQQRLNVLRRSSSSHSVALLQVNEDEVAMEQMRANLEKRGVELAPIWAASDDKGRLITTSVERIKGLEYDACFVVGLDDDDNRNLNYAKNRAYVALSRPALHLAIFCQEIPRSLQKANQNPGLIDVIRI